MALAQQFGGAASLKQPGITIVGCGPGALDHLTPAALKFIERAEILVGASRLLELFPGVGAERIPVSCDVADVLNQLEPRVGRREIVVLVTGDPGVCSLAQPVIRRFGWQRCRVVPGISSVQVAFARIGLDWTDARLISAHHYAPDFDPATLATETKIAVLAGNVTTTQWIVALAARLQETHTIIACEDLTLPQEKLSCLTPAQLAVGKLSPQSILLFIGKKLRT
jgi:cobalt-precorrin-7 (C5)-methyltransferase